MSEARARLVQQMQEVLALDGDLMTLDDMIELARDRKLQVWGGDDAVVVTELMTFPRKRVLNGILAAGNLRSILALEAQCEAFARDNGASIMLTHGRPGWGRVGRRTGWAPHSVCYTKRLTKPNGAG